MGVVIPILGAYSKLFLLEQQSDSWIGNFARPWMVQLFLH